MFFASGRQPLADATVIRRGRDIVRDAFYFVCCCPHGNSAAATVAAKVNLVPLMEVHEQLDQARKDIAEGKGFAVDGKEALASLLESI